MTTFGTRLLALRELGVSALFHYATYRIGLSSGLVARRTPASVWEARPFATWLRDGVTADAAGFAAVRAAIGPRFFFDANVAGLPRGVSGAEAATREADEILAGRFRLFGGPPIDLGLPPDWFAPPPPLADRPRWPDKDHWTKVQLDQEGSDARLVWELSRFGWVYPLARAYRATGAAKYAEGCWTLIDDWRRANQPNCGVHWTSAQEVGLRLLALAFAERAFTPAWRAEPERLQTVAQMVGWHAERIPPTVNYARAQANNHLLSEAAALFTAGALFPELRESRRWSTLGRRLLEEGFARQVFDDGGYVQHSATYQRLALAVGVWSVRLAELAGQPFSPPMVAAIGRLSRSLAIQADPASGRASILGPDDGSEVLPLSEAAAGDVRPIVSAASRLAFGETWYPAGPWDELSGWLGLGTGTRTDTPRADDLETTGLHFLYGRGGRGSLRCVRFHERPGHSDQLHVDLWRGDRIVALDPGSYLYNGPAPWQEGLAGAVVHNAPIVDGEEPMVRAGRFLWTDRAQGRRVGRWADGPIQAVRCEHDGYRRHGVTLARTVALIDESSWLVLDQALGAGRRRLTVGWNLPDGAWSWSPGELRVTIDGGDLRVGWDSDGTLAGLARAGAWVAGDEVDGPLQRWGWASPRYSAIEPCLRLILEVHGELPLMVRTRLSPDGSWPETLTRAWEGTESLEANLARLGEMR